MTCLHSSNLQDKVTGVNIQSQDGDTEFTSLSSSEKPSSDSSDERDSDDDDAVHSQHDPRHIVNSRPPPSNLFHRLVKRDIAMNKKYFHDPAEVKKFHEFVSPSSIFNLF